MKPFNLEAAKAGKPIVTRDGRVAKFVAHEPDAVCYPVVALVSGAINVMRDDGRSAAYSEMACDLFMAEEEITVYFNQYADGFGNVHRTEKAVSDMATYPGREFIKTHAVKIKV